MNTLVLSSNGKPVTNSLLVAQKFDKNHRDVMRSIRSIIQQAENSAGQPAQNCARQMYIENQYVDKKGELRPSYIIDRDGFSLLVMGFTGSEALKFKIDFIMAFNKMEEKLKALQSPIVKKSLPVGPIGERLKELIDRSHLNKNKLSVKMGISSNSVITRIVNNRERGMSLKNIQRIMLLFPDLNPDWLILGKGEMLKRETPETMSLTKAESIQRELKAAILTSPDYFTIVGYATINKMQIGLKVASRLGRKAAMLCKEKGYIMDDIPDPRFGRVHSYPKMVLQQVFNESLI